MELKTPIPELNEVDTRDGSGMQINLKRVAARAISYWYLVVLSLLSALSVAYLVNRYSTRIYPVTASIIIKENEENVGAKFLYDNELINPYRNFYNELYIMRSYPLLQEVMESLSFHISLYREGDIKTTEYYDPAFPVEFHLLKGSRSPYGRPMYFRVDGDDTFYIQYKEEGPEAGKEFPNLRFNDTIRVNGAKFIALRRADISRIKGQTFVLQFNDPLALAKSYSSRLNAKWAQVGASVVNLEVTGPIAQKEIDFLSRFIERYQFYDVEKKNRAASMAIGFLDDQLMVIRDSLDLYEDQVERFKRKNVITSLNSETNRLYLKVQELEAQKVQYTLHQNYFDYITKLLRSEQYDGIFTPASVGISDNVIARLITELIDLQSSVNVFRNKGGVERMEDNPRLQEKLQQIRFVKNNILKTIDNTRSTQKINIDFIDQQIRVLEEQLARLPATERELITIQRNYSLRENLYVYLLQKRTEAGLSRASTTSDIVVVNPPMAGGPISPKVMQNYGVAAGAGFAFPLLIFLLLELLNTKIQSREDIEKITTVPVIGGIGHNPEMQPTVVFQRPRSAMAESFRALRSNLNYFTANREHQVFMVTSSIPGEGKSFTTLNLATVFAMAGKRTLIVGADLRKPKLFSELEAVNDSGLSQYLSEMVTVERIVQPTTIENLFLMPAGPMPPNPSELLMKPAMEALVDELRRKFDFVIFDTPPLSFVTDAFVLSKYADHVLFIVRQDFTPRVALGSLEEYYSAGKLSKVSILFNDVRKSGLGYGYDGYGYGYGYGYYNFTYRHGRHVDTYYSE